MPAAARGGRARRRRAGGRQHRHQGPARPRRLSAPPRYWRRRSRAISLRSHHAHTQPGQRRQLHGGSGEPGGGGQEDASGSAPRRATASSAFSSCSAAASPPPPAAAAAWSFSSSSSCRRRHRRCWCRRCRSTNYIRATRPLRPSANLGSFRRAPPLPASASLPAPRSSGTPPSANLGSPRPSSSSEACFASSRPVSSFRSSSSLEPFGEIPLEVLHVNKGMGGAPRNGCKLNFPSCCRPSSNAGIMGGNRSSLPENEALLESGSNPTHPLLLHYQMLRFFKNQSHGGDVSKNGK
ncbi:uncharacterized protein LOC131398901 [Diceros bicornis minor]|uniref:uncharacterized protein LOC131398901 n=1 Tax=Diceros bicornis minor TaxID=77932 RepID=UPI0026EFBB36|nr:uncharacterized protein LOC131398901 [Diceros bicornis minor]